MKKHLITICTALLVVLTAVTAFAGTGYVEPTEWIKTHESMGEGTITTTDKLTNFLESNGYEMTYGSGGCDAIADYDGEAIVFTITNYTK